MLSLMENKSIQTNSWRVVKKYSRGIGQQYIYIFIFAVNFHITFASVLVKISSLVCVSYSNLFNNFYIKYINLVHWNV